MCWEIGPHNKCDGARNHSVPHRLSAWIFSFPLMHGKIQSYEFSNHTKTTQVILGRLCFVPALVILENHDRVQHLI